MKYGQIIVIFQMLVWFINLNLIQYIQVDELHFYERKIEWNDL